MRLYVVGGTGMIGHSLLHHFRGHITRAPGVDDVPRIDICNYPALLEDINRFCPHVIVNLAAICSIEKCEQIPSLAIHTHIEGSANLALITSAVGAEYVYMSSCSFDGRAYSYRDSDPPSPITFYGKTKVMGEFMAKIVLRHHIIRPGWCFGGGVLHDTKFIGKLYRQILDGKRELFAVSDKYGSLTYLPELCKAIEKILESQKYGIHHVVCSGTASRFEVADAFADFIAPGRVTVRPVRSALLPEYFVQRPESERLVPSRIPGFKERHWRDCLIEYCKELKG